MVDHHVDRPEVEAGQPAQLTGTNRSMHWSAAPSGKDHVQIFRSQKSEIRKEGGKRLLSKTHTTRFLRKSAGQRLGQSRRTVLISDL